MSSSSSNSNSRTSPPPSQRQKQSNSNASSGSNAAANAAQQALAAAAALKSASQAGVVRICGTAASECGYCKGSRASKPEEVSSSSKAYSLLGDFLTPKTYEGFLYRGWRRSGTYLYKPDNWNSCCPALTIRLPVREFEPTKSQRKVVKKMEQVLQPIQRAREVEETKTAPAKKKQKKNKQQQNQLSLQVQTPAEQAVLQSGILDQLQQWTQPIVNSLLEQYATAHRNNSGNQLPQNLSSSVRFKIKPPQGKSPKKQQQKGQGQRQLNQPVVTLCTTICAALAGQSKGIIDRDTMSHQLVEQLSSFCGKPQTLTSTSSTWILDNIYRHAHSGQVFCDIQFTEKSLQHHPNKGQSHHPHHEQQQQQQQQSGKDTPMLESDLKNKLQEWLEKYGATMAPFSNQSPTTTTTASLTPPFSFSVETLPAHESALDPQVHKLYFLYQTRVHNDSDPFTCDLSEKMNNSMSSGIGAPTHEDGGLGEDDEWSTPISSTSTSSTNEGQSNGSTNANSNEPVKQHDGGHRSWVDSAKRMLQREYPNENPDRLKHITKTFGSFFQFLVESPFPSPDTAKKNDNSGVSPRCTITTTPPSNSTVADSITQPGVTNLPCGTYHQQYRIEGMLVAVGVVDILPHGLSSVYLFYHPQFARDLVPLGKYAILQEIEFARSLEVPYYYLGYYIHSCTKMKYKAEYRPSELLCPTTYKWVDATRAQKIIQKFSPVHNCCTLYYDPSENIDLSIGSTTSKENAFDQSINMINSPFSDSSDLGKNDDKMEVEDPAIYLGNNTSRFHQPRNATNAATTTTSDAASQPLDSLSKTKKDPKMPPGILKKPATFFPPNPHVEQVKMDVGVGVPVTLSMLHERGRETVRPLLDDFVKEAGPELSRKCLVKFT